MGFMEMFKKKKSSSLLTEEDSIQLKEIERNSYMEAAKVIVAQRGKQKAKEELEIKQKPKAAWDMS